MPTITLVRHGESESNVSGDLTNYDPGLTERGKQQASSLQGYFDLVVVSPLKRAKQTLQYSKVAYDKLLVINEAREIKHDVNATFLHPDEKRDIENTADMARRMLRFKEKLRALAQEYDNILVVCHLGTIRHLTSTNAQDIIQAGGDSVEPDGIKPDNCQLVKLEL